MTGPVIVHKHPPAEMDAPGWPGMNELLAHLYDQHGLLISPAGKTLVSLAAIHAAEHPVQAGITQTTRQET